MSRFFFAQCIFSFSLLFSDVADLTNDKQTNQHNNFPSYFMWSYGISSQVDIAPFEDLLNFMTNTNPASKNCVFQPPYIDIEGNKLIWLHPTMLSNFIQTILPSLKQSVYLIVNNSDHAFPTVLDPKEQNDLLNHQYIAHIFVQNCDLKTSHEKLTLIPIGLDYHTGIKHGKSAKLQEKELEDILKLAKPTCQRIPRIFVDFQHNDTSGERKAIFNHILESKCVDYFSQPVSRETLWKKKTQYVFSVSPHGNGLDCHRTWEDLILGCIVIVKTSSLDPLYEGLPVVIIQNWNEICPENLAFWLDQYGDAFTNPVYREKLTNYYWTEKIQRTIGDNK